jgi:hypothetical protein
MAAELIPDGFWNLIEPLLLPQKSKLKGGRPRVPDSFRGSRPVITCAALPAEC